MRKRLAVAVSALVTFVCIAGCLGANGGASQVRAAMNPQVAQYLDMDELEGFAAVSALGLDTTTGGNMGDLVIVDNTEDFVESVKDDIPRVVVVKGEIVSMLSNADMDIAAAANIGDKRKGGYAIKVGSNKTIVGFDENAALYGGISIESKSNIIVSNLSIHGVWPYTGPSDTVNINDSHHIWLNHLNIWNSKDGNIDTTLGSDYVTVSWCKLWYEDVTVEWDTTDATTGQNIIYNKGTVARAENHGHRLSCLISSGAGDHEDTDMGRLHVTYHHNWFADYVYERMPRTMYGRTHAYNNYYTCEGNYYCIGVDCYASALVEGNYFDGVKNPHMFNYPNNPQGACIIARDNEYENTSGEKSTGQKNSMAVEEFTETVYDYTLNQASDVPTVVGKYAGVQAKGASNPKEGTKVAGVSGATAKPSHTPLPARTDVPKSTDNPITFSEDAQDNGIYTYHGQNKDGSNGLCTISNPFAGKDFSENPSYSGGYPVWTKGVTIGYWVKLPSGAGDAAVLNFQLENDRQVERSTKAYYDKCVAYDPKDSTYAMGTQHTYVDADGREFKVLEGYGSNVCYNPNYPAQGCYAATTAGGAYYAYEKGTDSSDKSNWRYLNYIGEGMYEKYGFRFDEDGGENSLVQEAEISGSFCLYASGTMGFKQDDGTAVQINPNVANYGMNITAHTFNQFYYFGNGSVYSNGISTPTMAAKDEWHYVVEVITNDWVQCYMDGEKLGIEYFNYFGRELTHNRANISGESFNLGYKAKNQSVRVKDPADICKNGMKLLDFISDKDTMLMVGGTGVCSAVLFQNTIQTPDGTQIKNLEFYDVPVAAANITSSGIKLDTQPATAPPRTEEPMRTPLPTTEAPITPPGTDEPSTEDVLWGDIDGKDGVTLQDARLAVRIALKIQADVTMEQEARGDVMHPGDGITLDDAFAILKRAMNVPVIFDAEG